MDTRNINNASDTLAESDQADTENDSARTNAQNTFNNPGSTRGTNVASARFNQIDASNAFGNATHPNTSNMPANSRNADALNTSVGSDETNTQNIFGDSTQINASNTSDKSDKVGARGKTGNSEMHGTSERHEPSEEKRDTFGSREPHGTKADNGELLSDAERFKVCAQLVEQLTDERTAMGGQLPFPESTVGIPQTEHVFGPDDPTARDFTQQWHRFRALVNTREPIEPPSGFLNDQNHLLATLITEQGITNADTIPVTSRDSRMAIWRGDITTLAADAIVNAANNGMTGCWRPLHSCIDNAIHTFAGVQLRAECARYMQRVNRPEPTGQATLTGAYNLPSRHVIHTVGPIVQGNLTDLHCAQLASSYRNCLDAAARAGDTSIGICCVSTGVFGFPADRAACIATDTVRTWMDNHADTPMRVIFVVFGDRDEAIYRALLDE